MRRYIVPLIVAALMFLPAAGALAGVGNGTLQAPPGLLNAKLKIEAAIQRQIAKQEEKYAKKTARIQEDLDAALSFGDLEKAAKLGEKLQKESDKHDRKLTKLQDKLTGKMAKFDAKVLKWQEKHGIVVEEEPPPDE